MYDRADDVTEGKIVSVFVGLFKYLPILHHSLPNSVLVRNAPPTFVYVDWRALAVAPERHSRRDTFLPRLKDETRVESKMARRIIIESNTRIWMLPTTGWATASTNARDGFNTWSRICLWIAYLKSCWFDWTRDRSSTNFSRRDLLRDAIVPSSFAWTNRGKKSTIEISRKYLGRPAPGKISPGRSMIWIISREFDRPTFSPSVEQRKYFEYR